VARKRQQRQTFADMVRAEQEKPATQPEARKPGLWGAELVDQSGRVFRLAEGVVTPDRRV
jgi:hypothetical protein